MLYKNTMRPAYAAAVCGKSFADSDRSKTAEYFTASEQSAFDDEYGSFSNQGSAASKRSANQQQRQRSASPRKPKRAKNGFSSFIKRNAKSLLIVGGILVALILLITLLVAVLFSAPKKNIKLEDNVYFTFVDSNGKYRVVSNGDTLKQSFDGEIKLTTAKDNSFAYVTESVANEEGTGYNIYVLKGNKLENVIDNADSVISYADYAPGIIYKAGSRFHYYSEDNHTPITNNKSADNFIISGDASTVVYTMESTKEEDKLEIRYFCKGASPIIGYNFTPLSISIDGKYVYGVVNSALCCITVEDNGEKYEPTAITKSDYGEILGVTGINVKGDEIIFAAATAARTMSYIYSVKDGAKPIAEGVFTPLYFGADVVCPESFINSYFTCKKSVYDDESESTETLISTYFLDKNGARKMADTTGKFSPDGKYFYYVDEDSILVRVPLSSKNFEADAKVIMNEVADFTIIENGDINVMVEDVDKGWIYYLDATSLVKKVIAHSADLDSMQICANSIYYSETNSDDVTTIYVSTEGSTRIEAEFKSSSPTETPIIEMGAGKKGFAYFTDESGKVKLFYTSNGKKFSLVSDSCTIPGYDGGTPDVNEPTAENSSAG